VDLVKELLSRGARSDLRDNNGKNVFDLATEAKKSNIIRILSTQSHT